MINNNDPTSIGHSGDTQIRRRQGREPHPDRDSAGSSEGHHCKVSGTIHSKINLHNKGPQLQLILKKGIRIHLTSQSAARNMKAPLKQMRKILHSRSIWSDTSSNSNVSNHSDSKFVTHLSLQQLIVSNSEIPAKDGIQHGDMPELTPRAISHPTEDRTQLRKYLMQSMLFSRLQNARYPPHFEDLENLREEDATELKIMWKHVKLGFGCWNSVQIYAN